MVKTGGLADVARALPHALSSQGNHVTVVVPYYRQIAEKHDAPVVLESELVIDDMQTIGYAVRELSLDGVRIWALDCYVYYYRPELYAENNEGYQDNAERFAFFSAASLDLVKKLNFRPDVVHCNDWHTGLVPFLLKTRYAEDTFFAKTKSLISIHNAAFKGIYNRGEFKVIPELTAGRFPDLELDYHTLSMLKAGVAYADKINAVSPNYAQELCTDLGSQGMGADFQSRRDDLVGIVNGCDYSAWSPENDAFLPVAYKANKQSMARGKKAARRALCEEVGLPEASTPVIGMVCRLTGQKGLHYLLPILDELLLNDILVVIVGTGDPKIAEKLHETAARHPSKFAFVEAYNNRLAHWVEAASDIFLMPSEFEPCGLNQMYSMAYGTLPLVRNVGGLKDTVVDYDDSPQFATGFVYSSTDPLALLVKIQRALLLFSQNPQEFKRVQLNAMTVRFDWEESAQSYLELYQSMLEHEADRATHGQGVS